MRLTFFQSLFISTLLQLTGLSGRNFVVSEHGRYFSCSLEYEKDGEKNIHRSDETVFHVSKKCGGSSSRTHLRVGAVKLKGAGEAGDVVLYRTRQHAIFAAAAVAVQKENRFWFEKKYLSSGSFHIIFPSHVRYDSAFEYPTRHLQKTSQRADPIAFLIRRGDSVVFLDAGAMQEKDRLETQGANELGIWSDKDKGRYDLRKYRRVKHTEFELMSEEEQADRLDRYSGNDDDLFTFSSEATTAQFKLNSAITIEARKVMAENQHPFLPLGWCLAVTERKSGKSVGRRDEYYFSPRGYMFRSRPEVERFLRCYKSEKSNEVLAKEAYDSGRFRE